MVRLSEQDLLGVWEEGRDRTPIERALLLLERALPEEGWQALEGLPVGRRDARLLELRELLFGPRVAATASCPSCGEQAELEFSLADLRHAPPGVGARGAGTDSRGGGEEGRFTVEESGYEIMARLPDSTDLAAVVAEADGRGEEEARTVLLERCLVQVRRDGRAVAREGLPEDALAAVARRLEEADPQADLHAALTCPGCGHEWRASFDIVQFLWREVEDQARRIFLEVHALATSYGWSEPDVLALSPTRRRIYMELTGS